MKTIFVVLQVILLLFMALHDWISLPPFNDIKTLKQVETNLQRFLGSFFNSLIILIPLLITIYYQNSPKIPLSAISNIVIFYLLLTIGTILSWWVPYFCGSSEKHKKQFARFKNTHHFLPSHKDYVVPNTLHVILHLQIWACFFISVYLFLEN